MTKRASINQADLNRLAAVAKRNNVTVEIEAEGYKIRIYPGSVAPGEMINPQEGEFASLADWRAWRDRERAREAQPIS